MIMYTHEAELETMVIHQMDDVKQHYIVWTNPLELARELGISVTFGKLGPDQEGAAFAEDIVLDSTIGVRARQRFTLYHEIVHHLIRRNDKLYSILHEQYQADKDFTRILERLCNIGAAEFVLSRNTVRAVLANSKFSIELVKELSKVDEISSTAACVQLALCAKHSCITVVCTMTTHVNQGKTALFGKMKSESALQVNVATRSACTAYTVARGCLMFKGHFFYEVYEQANEKSIREKSSIPFRNNQSWVVESEAIRIGKQLFGVFHLEPPLVNSPDQLSFF